jgi:hypothetical protein
MTRQPPFVPRPYQHLIVDHILNVPKCAVWAGMGMGKSGGTLKALSTILAIDDGPVLIVAPLRVARSTWPDEARKWSTFHHLRVVPVVGSEAERDRALRVPADIYTTNFENLPWLVERYEKIGWPFKIVVIDESTKLKGFRLRQGTQRAKALSRVMPYIERLIELSGTPAPNGLADLWGQMWFIDAGQRLGRTFDAFRQRWFQKSYDGFNVEPKDCAQDQIQRALKDVCLTVEAKDWFDLKDPIVSNIYVDLPAKARALYEDMEKRMFMELAGHEVEAFGAAARTVKCIAEGTEILTTNGWKPIERWVPGDSLWDGVEWVNADRLVCNGYMPVVNCRGVWMTPDHKVLTDSHGWITAEEINNATGSDKPNWASVRLPDGYLSGWFNGNHTGAQGDLARTVHLRERNYGDRVEPYKPAPRGGQVLRVPTGGNGGSGPRLARDDKTPGLDYLAKHASSLHRSARQRLAQLRRARHRGLRPLAILQGILEGHGADLCGRADARAPGQQWQLRAGKLHLGDAQGASEQHQAQRVYRNASGPDDGIAGGGPLRGETGDAGATPPARVDRRARPNSARVFDLVNCGPRHRFLARNAEGQILVVHNCLQIANGAAYVGESNAEWVGVHDAKLDALDEVLEESGGMPVLVAYNFKSDLARLKKAFPKGRQLDADPKTIVEWNAGKIPVLFAHPASAGHGLNLQDGGNILVFFGHDWNLENRLQIIERIGPTRQMQAGHDRAMFIYNIIAKDTVDELVLKRVETKREVQDILLDAMKVKGYK